MPAEQLVQFWQEHYEEQSKMHTHTEFGIPNSKSEDICYDTIILETWSEVKVNSDPKIVLDTLSPKDASTHQNFGFLSQIM